MHQNSYLTIANLVSALRLPLGILFCFAATPLTQLIIIALAAISDGLDGWIARKTNTQSPLGAIIDPLFDRVFILITFLWLFISLQLSWWLLIPFFIRDIISSGAYIANKIHTHNRSIEFKARLLGKTVTVLQFLTIAAMLTMGRELVIGLIILTGVLSVASIIDYYRHSKKHHDPNTI